MKFKQTTEYLIKLSTIVSLLFVAFYSREFFNKIIYDQLTVSSNWSNMFFDIFLITWFLILTMFFIYRLYALNYKYSYFQFLFLIVPLSVILLFYSVERSWSYTTLYFIDIPHILLLVIFLVLLLLVGFVNLSNSKSFNSSISIFKEDNALKSNEFNNDIFNYNSIAVKLKEKIILQNFESSFTVGIIGPWGNGKSSFINLLSNQFKNDNNTIPVYFYPYLNHTESEISSEFFHALQYALRPYSGRLSNLILTYSKKLLNFYNDKNISNFLFSDFLSENASAHDTLSKINKTLEDINKRIVVFVDDLDRLNHEEILQVLKLIRNTANFKNTIFIVAMDKGYVLSRLSSDNAILKNNFIDKFFQLEIYLPEINHQTLIDEFLKIVKTTPFFDEQVKIRLENVIISNQTLFYDHIKNLRDVKRLFNQIIFEYDFVDEEIQLSDFINFIFLKLSFPNFLDLLKRNPERYLSKSGSYYNLIQKETKKDANDLFLDLKFTDDVLVEKYEIYGDLTNDEKCKDGELLLTCTEKKLLVKTLAYLFGDENKISSSTSIKFENNFRRFMQLDYSSSQFLNKDFNRLIKLNKFEELKKSIEKIIVKEQEQELLDRLKFYYPTSKIDLKNSILIYILLFETLQTNKLSEIDILRDLATFIHVSLYTDQNLSKHKDVVSNWIISDIFESERFKVENQLKLIGYLWESKQDNKLWEISEDKLSSIVLDKFDDYLKIYENSLWDVNDYTFYRIYHKIKPIGNIKKEVVNKILYFFENNSIKAFCAQSTEFSGFVGEQYRISDGVLEFFESKEKYRDFIKSHKNVEDVEITEYIDFLDLCAITNYTKDIIYRFKKFTLITEKYNHSAQVNPETYKERLSKYVQYFFEIDKEYYLEDFGSLKFNDSKYRLTDFQAFLYNDKIYLMLTHNYGTEIKHIQSYVKLVFEYIKGKGFKDVSVVGKFEIKKGDQKIFKLYSKQPA